jgi:autotransporter passenger strand-loop-strand repeat protein
MTTLGTNDQYLTEWISASERKFLYLDPSSGYTTATFPGHSENGAIIDSGGDQFVEAGGTALNTTVNKEGHQEVDAGGIAFNTTVNSGQQLVSGGTASGTVLNDGGEQTVSSGGTTVGTRVQGGGAENVMGGKALYTFLSAGSLTVANGGVTSRTTVQGSGCFEVIDSGGTDRFTTVSSGGLQGILASPRTTVAISTTLSGGHQLVGSPVPGGGRAIASGTQVSSGGVQDVEYGGTAIDTTIFGGGIAEAITSGTFVNPTISAGINSGGVLALYSGSVVRGAITFGPTGSVDSGGTLMIFGSAMPNAMISGFAPGDGFVTGDTVVLPDVPLVGGARSTVAGKSFVSYGGCTLFETTNNVLQICEGGHTYELQFDPFQTFSGGFVLSGNQSGATAGGTVVEMSSGTVTGYSTSALPPSPWGGAVGSNPPNPYLCTCYIDAVDSAGVHPLGTGFIIGRHTILTAAHVVSGFSPSQISVFPGDQTGHAGVSINMSGAQVHTNWDGTDINRQDDYAIIDVSGTQDLAASYGMFLIPPLAFNGGTVNITGYPSPFLPRQCNDIGSESQDSTNSGLLDEQNVNTYGGNSGSPVWVYNGAYVEAIGIHVAGQHGSGTTGTAVGLTPSVISAITTWEASDFGSKTVSSGDTFDTPSGDSDENILVQDGGVANDAGRADNTTVQDGGVLNDAGTAVNIVIQTGGVVNNAGVAADIAVSGTLNIQAGGTAAATAVYAGGVETIGSGGTDFGAQILGGRQDVSGTADGAVIDSGGEQIVYSGGIASGTIINSGGEQVVWAGGTANATTVNSGGFENVYVGGSAGSVTISGGVVEFDDGASGGTITFAGRNGELDIFGAATSVTMISGFAPGNFIDLFIPFIGTGLVQLQDNNVLWIFYPDQGALYTVNFDPTQNFAAEFFHLSPSNLGTTLLTLGQRHQAGDSDFLGNGTSDVLFRNDASGDTWFEAMSNGAFAGWNPIGGSDTHYSAVGLGEFFGIATSDILYRNASTGDTWIYGVFAGWSQIGGSDTQYSVAGVGDFFGDGTNDILFRNNSSGDTWFEGISAGAFNGWYQIGGSDTQYGVVGVGDFYGNGISDILFRNSSTGDTWIETISDGAFNAWRQIGGSDTHYSVAGVGDFDGNGISDILFRNNSTGDTWFEGISNGTFAGWHQVGGSDTHYAVAGMGDYFNTGTSDILFRNNYTGDTWFEAISNGVFNSWHQVGGSDTSYTVKT